MSRASEIQRVTDMKRTPQARLSMKRQAALACSAREASMIGVFVTFRYQGDFDGEKICRIAGTARSRFEKMPGLRCKAFTFNPEAREAINFYVWDSEEAAKAFFNEELVQRVTGLYDVRPISAFGEIQTLGECAARKHGAA